jgi:DNA polymerase V
VAEKLRKQDSAASAIMVFLHTNRFSKTPGNGLAAELASYAQAALSAIFRPGYQYQKVGVMLTGLVPADFQ